MALPDGQHGVNDALPYLRGQSAELGVREVSQVGWAVDLGKQRAFWNRSRPRHDLSGELVGLASLGGPSADQALEVTVLGHVRLQPRGLGPQLARPHGLKTDRATRPRVCPPSPVGRSRWEEPAR